MSEARSFGSHISADLPITSKPEDRLNRAGFADALANVIRSWQDKPSLECRSPCNICLISLKGSYVRKVNIWLSRTEQRSMDAGVNLPNHLVLDNPG